MLFFSEEKPAKKVLADLQAYFDKENPFLLREADVKFWHEEEHALVFFAIRKVDNTLCRITVARNTRRSKKAIQEKALLLNFFQHTGSVPRLYWFDIARGTEPTLIISEWLEGRDFNQLKKEHGGITDEHLAAAARAIARFSTAEGNGKAFRRVYRSTLGRRFRWFLRNSFRRHMLVWFWRMGSMILRRSVGLRFDGFWWDIKISPSVLRACRMLWRAEKFFSGEPVYVHFDGAYAENLMLLSDGTVKFARLEPLSMRRGIAFTAARFMETIGGSGEAPSLRERKIFIEEFCKEAGIRSYDDQRAFERLFLFELLAKFVADTIWVLWKAAWSGTRDPIEKKSHVRVWLLSLKQMMSECRKFF